jgi:hypothetical protein
MYNNPNSCQRVVRIATARPRDAGKVAEKHDTARADHHRRRCRRQTKIRKFWEYSHNNKNIHHRWPWSHDRAGRVDLLVVDRQRLVHAASSSHTSARGSVVVPALGRRLLSFPDYHDEKINGVVTAYWRAGMPDAAVRDDCVGAKPPAPAVAVMLPGPPRLIFPLQLPPDDFLADVVAMRPRRPRLSLPCGSC